MTHSYSNIWTHVVLEVKDQQPAISEKVRPLVKKALEEYFSETEDQQAGFSVLADHLHLLVKLPQNMSVDQLVHSIRGQISIRLEREKLGKRLDWEDRYHAHSVSLNRLSIIRSLIDRQELKHKEMTLKEELKFFGL
ncbi:MAG: transposase [Algoriphagus aquaeductus]|jgi:REP element-mobilizing transposase RayT|nr:MULTISPECIES: transposase [Algoriphagus]